MVFFLQTASELALLTSSEQDKTTLTLASNKGRTQGDELDLKGILFITSYKHVIFS